LSTKGNFTKVPFSIFDKLSERNMDLKDIIVYFGITRNIDGFRLSYRRISEITGVSRSMVQKSVERLVANKLVRFAVSKTAHTVSANGTNRNFVNDILQFRNLVDFDVEKFRMYPNAYLHLVSTAKQMQEIFRIKDASPLTPIDVGVLMYIRRCKFEKENVPQENDRFQLNSYSDSKALGIARATFRKSIKRLLGLRFIRISSLDRTVTINNASIKNFLTFKTDFLRKQSVKKIANPDTFTDIDRFYLRCEIDHAHSPTAVSTIKVHVLDLMRREYLSETDYQHFAALCDAKLKNLRENPVEPAPEQYADPRELFPLEVTSGKVNRRR
jgi:predicted XRE-type DNA-binding protein